MVSEASRRVAEEIVEAVIREMNRSDLGIGVKDWNAHVKLRRANAAKVVDAAIARAVAEAVEGERERIRNAGVEWETHPGEQRWYKVPAAALRAPSAPEVTW